MRWQEVVHVKASLERLFESIWRVVGERPSPVLTPVSGLLDSTGLTQLCSPRKKAHRFGEDILQVVSNVFQLLYTRREGELPEGLCGK